MPSQTVESEKLAPSKLSIFLYIGSEYLNTELGPPTSIPFLPETKLAKYSEFGIFSAVTMLRMNESASKTGRGKTDLILDLTELESIGEANVGGMWVFWTVYW